MYPNVRAEMARNHITVEKMAELCDVSTPTMSEILNGKRKLTFKRALQIRDILAVDAPLEILFEE